EEQRRTKWENLERERKAQELAKKQARIQAEIQTNQTRTQKVEKELDQLRAEIRQKDFSQQKTEDKLTKLIKYTQFKEERQNLLGLPLKPGSYLERKYPHPKDLFEHTDFQVCDESIEHDIGQAVWEKFFLQEKYKEISIVDVSLRDKLITKLEKNQLLYGEICQDLDLESVFQEDPEEKETKPETPEQKEPVLDKETNPEISQPEPLSKVPESPEENQSFFNQENAESEEIPPQPEPLPKITEKPEKNRQENTKGEETKPKPPLSLELEYDRVIASIKAGTIRGEAINLPLRSTTERKITIRERDFYLCRVADCSFNTIPSTCFHGFPTHCPKKDCVFSQREIVQYPNYCSRHECSSFVCSELVLAYEDGLAKYCGKCLPSKVIEVKEPKLIVSETGNFLIFSRQFR
ncbi:12611_t:CDS:2, partial [Racocetra fulgida]